MGEGATENVDLCAGGAWCRATAVGAWALLAGTGGRPSYLDGAGHFVLAAGVHGTVLATGAAGATLDDSATDRLDDRVAARGLTVGACCLSWPRRRRSGSVSPCEAVAFCEDGGGCATCARCNGRPCDTVSPPPPPPPLFGCIAATASTRAEPPRAALEIAADGTTNGAGAGRASDATGGHSLGAGAGTSDSGFWSPPSQDDTAAAFTAPATVAAAGWR